MTSFLTGKHGRPRKKLFTLSSFVIRAVVQLPAPPQTRPRRTHYLASIERYSFELVDGPLDGLKLSTRNYGLSFPVMISMTFEVEESAQLCRVCHYKFLFQYAKNGQEHKRGALYMHQKTIEVKVNNG